MHTGLCLRDWHCGAWVRGGPHSRSQTLASTPPWLWVLTPDPVTRTKDRQSPCGVADQVYWSGCACGKVDHALPASHLPGVLLPQAPPPSRLLRSQHSCSLVLCNTRTVLLPVTPDRLWLIQGPLRMKVTGLALEVPTGGEPHTHPPICPCIRQLSFHPSLHPPSTYLFIRSLTHLFVHPPTFCPSTHSSILDPPPPAPSVEH